MADEAQVTASAPTITEPAAPASSAATSSTPSVASTPSAETVNTSPSPVVAETPSGELSPAPVADALLAAEPKTTEVGKIEEKPGELKTEDKLAEGEKKPEVKAEEKKPEESKTEEKPAEEAKPITYEAFKLPDAYKDDSDAIETVTKFSGVLGKFESSPKTHEDFQKFGQEATDFYINGVNGALAKQQDFYVNLHQKNITDRLEAVRNDPQLGGKNFEKTSADMIEAVQAYGGSKEQILQLRKAMQESGMGVDPSLVRLVANMKSALDRYTKEPVSSNLTGTKPHPTTRGTIQTLYGS